jgi:hypothetical protein
MPTPFESAQLNLQLFELRREPVLREARRWFVLEFHPETFAEFAAIVRGQKNAQFRMVIGYWDMAASLVTTGAIDGDAFRAAHGEIFAAFSKVHPFLAELRAASGEPELANTSKVLFWPRRTRRKSWCAREALRTAARARAARKSQP